MQAATDEVFRGRATFGVAHHLSTVMNAGEPIAKNDSITNEKILRLGGTHNAMEVVQNEDP